MGEQEDIAGLLRCGHKAMLAATRSVASDTNDRATRATRRALAEQRRARMALLGGRSTGQQGRAERIDVGTAGAQYGAIAKTQQEIAIG